MRAAGASACITAEPRFRARFRGRGRTFGRLARGARLGAAAAAVSARREEFSGKGDLRSFIL